MKNGDIVSVKDTDIVGEVVGLVENKIEIKLQNGTSIIKLEDEVKRKKKCVCGMSKSFPACDGSHSGQ